MTPLLARGHIIPGEDKDSNPTKEPGGSEQFMHSVGEIRRVTDVRRTVHAYHPVLFAPTLQTIEAQDETGQRYRFEGEAVAMAPVPAWTYASLVQQLYRWTNTDDGGVAYGSSQEIWLDQRYPAYAAARLASRVASGA